MCLPDCVVPSWQGPQGAPAERGPQGGAVLVGVGSPADKPTGCRAGRPWPHRSSPPSTQGCTRKFPRMTRVEQGLLSRILFYREEDKDPPGSASPSWRRAKTQPFPPGHAVPGMTATWAREHRGGHSARGLGGHSGQGGGKGGWGGSVLLFLCLFLFLFLATGSVGSWSPKDAHTRILWSLWPCPGARETFQRG